MSNMLKTSPRPVLSPGSTLVDTHCHVDMVEYQDDLDELLATALSSGVTRIISVGIDIASSRRAIALAKQYDCIYATVGIHPHEAAQADAAGLCQLRELAAQPKVVGLGETGLDYAKQHAAKDVQQRAFAGQIEIAKALHLPVIIHDREAHADTLQLLREHGPLPCSGVLHCFSGNSVLAHQAIELGLYISISGIVTFANAHTLRQAVQDVPLDRLLLETDGPYLSPVPFRGRRNRPDYSLYTAAAVAQLKGVSLDTIAQQTTANAEALFGLSLFGLCQ